MAKEKLDKEEQDIPHSFERGEWTPVTNREGEIARHVQYARNTLAKDKLARWLRAAFYVFAKYTSSIIANLNRSHLKNLKPGYICFTDIVASRIVLV